jgi:hypothetical protein
MVITFNYDEFREERLNGWNFISNSASDHGRLTVLDSFTNVPDTRGSGKRFMLVP